MDNIAITTAQNVILDYPLASIFQRIIAYLIDLCTKFLIVFSLQYFINHFQLWKDLDDWELGGMIFLTYLPVMMYSFIMEALCNGQTIGKMIMGTRVISIDKYYTNLADLFTRWMFNLVDFWLFFGIIALISINNSKNNQRIGDIAANTAVISIRKKTIIDFSKINFQENQNNITYPQVSLLSDYDMQIIQQRFHYAINYNAENEIEKLAEQIKGVLKIYNKQNPREFIQTIISDFKIVTSQNILS